MGAWLRACALSSLAVACVSGCGLAPQLRALPAPSPTVLDALSVGVGSVVPCDGEAMRRHCDGWVLAAQSAAGVAWADVLSATVHVGWSTAPRTEGVSIVVELRLRNGSVLYEPIFCGAGPDPGRLCDFSDVALPSN